MASEKQIEANRLNALKGGPRTEAGKAAVRLNAVSHGLLSKEVLLPGEDGVKLAALRRRFQEELQPVGELETLLVERLVSSFWRLRRIVGYSKNQIIKYGRNYLANPEKDMRYETALERQIYKALHEFQTLQTCRLAKKAAETQAGCEENSSPEEKATMALADAIFKNSPLFNDRS